MKNALVTSISKKIPLLKAVRKSLEELHPSAVLYGADSDENCLGRLFVDQFWHTKPFDAVKIEEVIAFCKRGGIRFVIPTRDGELHKWASFKKTLAANDIYVMVSSEKAVEICLDKLAFAKYFKDLAVPTSEKPKDGYTYVKDRSGAHLESIETPIYQPEIQGAEYSIDLYLTCDSKVKGGIVRTRDLIIDGESHVTSLVEEQELLQKCSLAAEKLGLVGHVLFQAIGEEKILLECNPRFGGASTLSIKAGLNSFLWFFLETEGNPLIQYPFEPRKPPLKLVRYKEDHFIDV